MIQNLVVNPVYKFASDVNDDPARFILHFVPAAVTLTATAAGCANNDGAIQVNLGRYNVNNTVVTWDNYTVSDHAGNIVAAGNNAAGVLNINNLPAGTYNLQLSIGTYTTTEQVSVTGSTPVIASSFGANATQVQPNTQVQFTNASTGATAYDWNFGDGITSSLASPSHSYAAPGIYQVILTADNTDCSSTYEQTVTVEDRTTGITDPNAGSVNITGYSKQVSIVFHSFSTLDEVTLNIYDLTGRKLVAAQKLSTGDSKHVINMTDIANGYYFVVLTGKNYEKAEKVFLTNE